MNRDLTLSAAEGRALSDRLVAPNATLGVVNRPHHAPQLDARAILRIIREWRWLIIGAAALGLALGVVATLLTTPLYKAWVTLEVNPPTVDVSDEQQRNRFGNDDSTFDFVQTQVGLLGSRSLAERVAQELNLVNTPSVVGQGDATARLNRAAGIVAGGLDVIPPKEGRLIRFSFTSPNPQLAAQIANGVADGFINSNLQRKYESSNYARRFLERQIGKTRGDLERSERQLVSYAQSEGIINLQGAAADGKGGGQSDAGSLQGESLQALNTALAAATARRVAAEGAYRAAQASGPTNEVNESTSALRQTRAGLEAEYQEKRTLLKPDHPDMISLRSRIDELDKQIARETAQVSGGRSNSLAQEYRGAAAAEASLQGRVNALKGSVLDLRGRSVQYNILQREVDTNRALYDALLQRYKEIGVAGGVGAAPISIVDRALPPGAPFKPSLPLNLLVGLGLGLLAGVGSALGFEFLSDTIKTREDVRNKLQIACLGAIPKRLAKSGTLVDDIRDPSSAVAEAYSAVAAGLRFTTEDGVPRSVLITSTQESEGKSSTALAVAQSFARQGRNVLLIDADLRKPSFKTGGNEQGLVGLLTNHEDVEGKVVTTQFENLWLLPCGPLPPNPADLLSTRRFANILDDACHRFDLVVVDGPPVLGLADAPLLAAAVAGTLFVVESGRTRTRAAVESLNRVEASGARVLGAVLTKSVERDGGYGYYSYRYGQIDDDRPDKVVLITHQAADADAV